MPGNLAYRFLARIDEVGVLLALDREWPDAEHAILALQNDVHPWGDVIGHQRRQADAEIDVKAIAQLPRDALHNTVALLGVFGRLGTVVGRWSFVVGMFVVGCRSSVVGMGLRRFRFSLMFVSNVGDLDRVPADDSQWMTAT